MSRSFTSNSEKFSWRRIIVDVVCVMGVLLLLEGMVRLPPVNDYLAARLDTYENLFWHDPNMPRYSNDLKNNPDYTFWFVGSSYMMTAIQPDMIESELSSTEGTPVTAQNFGMTVMTNLAFMSEMMSRWMLEIDQPRYMVLFIAEPNFSNPYIQESRNGTFEQTFLFPDSLSDYSGRFMYTHSELYHYLLLARNAPRVPYEDTLREPRENGGFRLHTAEPYTCPTEIRHQDIAPVTYEVGRNNLRQFINMTKQQDIRLIIITLPLPECSYLRRYADFETYQQVYLQPVAQLAQAEGIPFYDFDTRFQETVPADEQQAYYYDAGHANSRGADLFSMWTIEVLDQWLRENEAQE